MTSTKKISDNSLNFVSGGNCYETAADSKLLHYFLGGKPGQPAEYTPLQIRTGDHGDEIKAAWASIGVDATIYSGSDFFDPGAANVYKMKGKVVSRQTVVDYVNYLIEEERAKLDQW